MKRIVIVFMLLLIIQGLLISCKQAREKDNTASQESGKESALFHTICIGVADAMEQLYVPILETSNGQEHFWQREANRQIGWLLPTYAYAGELVRQEKREVLIRQILWEEAREEVGETVAQNTAELPPEEPRRDALSEVDTDLTEDSAKETAVIQEGELPFSPHGKQQAVELESISDYDSLMRSFYIVDSTTQADEMLINAQKFLEKDMTIEKNTLGPQILIYHTHSQEAFADSVQGDQATTIVGAGERLKEILEDTYGFLVLHHTESYDLPDRNKAYSKAKPSIEKLLQDNPSIQVVIDLHRDAMPEDKKQVVQIDGRSTAKFMFFNGLSYHKKTGAISYLKNDNLENNLAFSFQMQKAANEYYPGAARKIYLKGYRYNMHLMDKYLLIELGAQNNTVEEAMNACDVIAHLLYLVLSGEA